MTTVGKNQHSEERKVVVTGTPGTGKTTATKALAERGVGAPIIHLTTEIREADLWDDRDVDRDSLIADLDAIADYLGDWHGVLDSHLAHLFDADRVVVLRCEPSELESRLCDRGEPEFKARENAESEALDVILSEAVDRHGRENVYEIDSTDRSVEWVASEIHSVLEGTRQPSAGEVDFTEYLIG